MNKFNKKIVFTIVSIFLLSVAGVLTWTLLAPESANKFYERAFGVSIYKPSTNAVGQAKISFRKTEEEIDG